MSWNSIFFAYKYKFFSAIYIYVWVKSYKINQNKTVTITMNNVTKLTTYTLFWLIIEKYSHFSTGTNWNLTRPHIGYDFTCTGTRLVRSSFFLYRYTLQVNEVNQGYHAAYIYSIVWNPNCPLQLTLLE